VPPLWSKNRKKIVTLTSYILFTKLYSCLIVIQKIQLGQVEIPAANFIAGAMTGLTATLITYPLDTIRTRMLFTTKFDKEYCTWQKTCRSIYKIGGIG
jgi:hypothetical protein